ncbi:hypothetical protein, partial [Salmonella enterica]
SGYRENDAEATRIVRIVRNAEPAGESLFGLMQTLEESVGHPERLLVSFKIRAFRDLSSVPLSFGYTNREKSDAEDILSAGQEWE